MDVIAAAATAAFDRRLEADAASPVAVALSGGGDSLALLHLAADWCRAARRPLLALTVDHRLNPDSAAWTRDAGAAAARVGADWRALSWEGEKPSTGLPAAARAARHRLLADAVRAAGARVLLTGHTRDDVLEGDLMRAGDAPALGRLREWSPSPAWPEGRGLFLLRPLLEVRRAALREWLSERGLVWLDDPSNEYARYARVRARSLLSLREKVSPEATDEGGRRGRLSVSAVEPPTGQVQRSHPSSGCSAATFSLKGRRDTLDGRLLLDVDGLTVPVLSAALLCAAGTTQPPRTETLVRLLERIQSKALVQATLAGARIVADDGTIQIGREPTRAGLPTLGLPSEEPVVWDGRFEIEADAAGWSVAPLAGLMARLPADDRARLRAVPAWARGALPALTRDGTVRLPRPFADGPGLALSLAGVRLAGACGLIAREGEIGRAHHGAEAFVTLCSGPSD